MVAAFEGHDGRLIRRQLSAEAVRALEEAVASRPQVGRRLDHPTARSQARANPASMDEMPARASRILIVDDQPVFRQVARMLLVARGYTVVGEAGCASDALYAAERLAPDGVMLDVCLGEESGLDVAEALTSAQPSMTVVLVSADPPDTCAQRLDSCGARAFVLKSELAATDLSGFWG